MICVDQRQTRSIIAPVKRRNKRVQVAAARHIKTPGNQSTVPVWTVRCNRRRVSVKRSTVGGGRPRRTCCGPQPKEGLRGRCYPRRMHGKGSGSCRRTCSTFTRRGRWESRLGVITSSGSGSRTLLYASPHAPPSRKERVYFQKVQIACRCAEGKQCESGGAGTGLGQRTVVPGVGSREIRDCTVIARACLLLL